MSQKLVATLLLVGALSFVALPVAAQDAAVEGDVMMEKEITTEDAMMEDGTMMEKDDSAMTEGEDSMMEKDDTMMEDDAMEDDADQEDSSFLLWLVVGILLLLFILWMAMRKRP